MEGGKRVGDESLFQPLLHPRTAVVARAGLAPLLL